MNIEQYRVSHWREEFNCDNCGNPVFQGDTATEVNETFYYCSRRCAREHFECPKMKSRKVIEFYAPKIRRQEFFIDLDIYILRRYRYKYEHHDAIKGLNFEFANALEQIWKETNEWETNHGS